MTCNLCNELIGLDLGGSKEPSKISWKSLSYIEGSLASTEFTSGFTTRVALLVAVSMISATSIISATMPPSAYTLSGAIGSPDNSSQGVDPFSFSVLDHINGTVKSFMKKG